MMDEQLHISSRRQFLGAAAGTALTVTTAGCLSSLAGTSSNLIEPEEPTMPREGSPGEFYFFLEANGIEVDELAQEDNDLYLTYRTETETEEESDSEIMIVYEIYKQALIHRGSEIEFLYSEISNPFDGQALGWGINSEWIHELDSLEMNENESDSVEVESEFAGNGTTSNESIGNETVENEFDANLITLWSNIMNSKVYEEDLQDGEDSDIETENESESSD